MATPTAPKVASVPPAPSSSRTPPLSGTWTIEQRRFLGLVGGALCLGIIIGAKLGRGTERVVAAPCADCAEREIQSQRAAARARPTTVPGAPQGRPIPGNVPAVTFDPTAPPPGQGAASTDTSGAITDTSKGYVMDPTFIAGGSDSGGVPKT